MVIDQQLLDEMRKWLRTYINNTCIYRVAPGQRVLDGKEAGTKYSWQFYLRRGLLNSKFQNIAGILFWDMFAEEFKAKPFQIAGLETGATPLLSAITSTSHLFNIECNALSIRASRKQYGLRNRFEGIINYDLPVLLVDDICNSKQTIRESKWYCEHEELKIYPFGFTILNKDDENIHLNHDKYIGSNFIIKSIFSIYDFDLEYNDYVVKNGQIDLVDFIPERGYK